MLTRLVKLIATALLLDFSELDRQIMKLRELRDTYRSANDACCGKRVAELVHD